MKYFAPAILCTALLSACGGEEPSIAEAKAVPPSPAVAGLWVSFEAYDSRHPSDRYRIPSDELLYFNFTGVDENPVVLEAYSHSYTDNCFDYVSSNITYVGNNRYRNEANEATKFGITDGQLVWKTEYDGTTVAANFNKVTGLTTQDIPLCDTNSSIQNDDTEDGFYGSFTTTSNWIDATSDQ